MKGKTIALIVVAVILVLIFGTFMKYQGWRNALIALDEGVQKAWADVENVYQRRADLIPNLVETVKAYAKHEKETLQEVTKARSKMGGMVNLTGDAIRNPQLMQKFQQAQAGLGSALQRLMVVAERYPDLKANQNFRDLQTQLEGTENRIAVERRRYNEAARNFNQRIRQFPWYIVAGRMDLKKANYFEAEEGAKEAPKVKF